MGFDVPQVASRQLAAGIRSEIGIPFEAYMERNNRTWDMQAAANERCGVEIIDTTQFLCQKGRSTATREMLPVYSDAADPSETGNKFLALLLKNADFSNISNN